MKKPPKLPTPNEISLTMPEFLESYNKNIPTHYPTVSLGLLQKFKNEHLSLFKVDGLWTLDKHRKRIIDWLQSI